MALNTIKSVSTANKRSALMTVLMFVVLAIGTFAGYKAYNRMDNFTQGSLAESEAKANPETRLSTH